MLANAALRLDEATTSTTVAQAAAEVSIPIIADWCVVDLIDEEGSFRRAAIAARDARARGPRRAAPQPSRDHRSRSCQPTGDRVGEPVFVRDVAAWWADRVTARPGPPAVLQATGHPQRDRPAADRPRRGDRLDRVRDRQRSDIRPGGRQRDREIATRVGLAIGNVRSYEAEQGARRAAEELADRMERLQAVTRTLADATTIEDVVAIVSDEARRALGAESVVVGLLDDAGTRLDLVVREGAGQPFGATRTRVPIDDAVRS